MSDNYWRSYYLKRCDISSECARAWDRAQEAYYRALESGDPWEYINLRRDAMRFHEPTGDCKSDKIEGVYFPVLDDGQFQRLAEREPDGPRPVMDKINQIIRWGRIIRGDK